MHFLYLLSWNSRFSKASNEFQSTAVPVLNLLKAVIDLFKHSYEKDITLNIKNLNKSSKFYKLITCTIQIKINKCIS